MAALNDEPVHVVATLPAGRPDELASSRNATVLQFIPHGLALDRAVCAVTHGGMGATQKALARGVPVSAVPYGRDQFEVARRVEVAQCGTRLPAKKLSPSRLRAKVREAMTMTDGARRVAAGFKATGGRLTAQTCSSSASLASTSAEPLFRSSANSADAYPLTIVDWLCDSRRVGNEALRETNQARIAVRQPQRPGSARVHVALRKPLARLPASPACRRG